MRRRWTGLLLLVLLVGGTGSSLALPLPPLSQGMPYKQARKLLLDRGWSAGPGKPVERDPLQRSLQAWFLRRGMTEVEQCLPTGLGTCRAIFRDPHGQQLVLFTTSGSLGEGVPVKVTGWRFEPSGHQN